LASIVEALSRESRGITFLRNLADALDAGFVHPRKAKLLLEFIENIDSPDASSALGVALTQIDPCDDLRLNQEKCANTTVKRVSKNQVFATVQRAQFFGGVYETLPQNQKDSLERLSRLIRRFNPLAATKRQEDVLRKISRELEALSNSELSTQDGMLRINPTISPFGGTKRIAPSWFTLLEDDVVGSCVWEAGNQISSRCAEKLRNLLGLVHHGSSPVLNQPGYAPQLMCLYAIHGNSVPEGFDFGRPTVFHGDGTRFQQTWSQVDQEDTEAHGHAVDLNKFHFELMPPKGGPEVTIDNWDWPDDKNEVSFTIVGVPTLENRDWMPAGDEKFSRYILRGKQPDVLCNAIEEAIENW
jgi:hypothetical protein